MTRDTKTSIEKQGTHGRIGLPATVGLALLAVPRMVLHDLGLISDTAMNLILLLIPPAIWVAVALAKRVEKPILTLVSVGACYGLFLAVVHHTLWNQVFAGNPPVLGGNLGTLDHTLQTVILRLFTTVSSFGTGLLVGLTAGLVAAVIQQSASRISAQDTADH